MRFGSANGCAALLCSLLFVTPALTQDAPKVDVRAIQSGATPVSQLKVLPGFQVELLYSVPRETLGSWVNLCADPRGRLIVSDQYGGLYRVEVPPAGQKAAADKVKVDKIGVDLGEAQGLLWAFDSLYVVVNKGQKYTSGLYRVRDSDGDDQLDEVQLLRELPGGGEHGPHAVLLTPDGKHLMVVCGNQTKLVSYQSTRVPPFWGEDHLLPRMPDGRGFMRGVLGPGGAIYRVSADGQNWELYSVGFRNQFDAAFNRDGELFSYDADMEWDFNTPWYRPTRVCLVTSGSEFGWRNGAGKWPAYYADSLPAVVDIGPGSPTGISFGYGAKFPAKYQDALFICDWSYGKLYAVHLEAKDSAYQGKFEEFVSGSPLPLTDVIVNPLDGALYFTIGGRRTQSGLYRVTYTGKEKLDPSSPDVVGLNERRTRHFLETLHAPQESKAIGPIWSYLDHDDRFIRFAARVALEHQDPVHWREKAFAEPKSGKAITALLALTRVSAPDPFHRTEQSPAVDETLRDQILNRLADQAWDKLNDWQRLDWLRTCEIVLNRMGRPGEPLAARLSAMLESVFPSSNRMQNAELCQLLVYLDSPYVIERTIKLLKEAPTQEEQLEYARALRVKKTGWSLEQRKDYFQWFVRASGYRGGASFALFLKNIEDDAVATLSDEERQVVTPILESKLETAQPTGVAQPRPFVKKRTLPETSQLFQSSLHSRDFDRGRKLFGAANCFACHRFDNEGGAHGPDLTGLAGRFSLRDLLESIIDPSKVISDQYAGVIIQTVDGRAIAGRIVNLNQDSIMVMTNMLDPNAVQNIQRKDIESMGPASKSLMPDGLLDTLQDDEVLDLMAFLLSRGDRNHAMFRGK
jgi:putative heme-binding domain-containing protein